MKPATRKFPDDQYDRTGYRYFHKPVPGYVFYTDYKDILFPDEDIYEELTLLEYLGTVFKNHNQCLWLGKKPMHYYFDCFASRVFKQEVPLEGNMRLQEIHLSEYIELSILFDQNHEDTLL